MSYNWTWHRNCPYTCFLTLVTYDTDMRICPLIRKSPLMRVSLEDRLYCTFTSINDEFILELCCNYNTKTPVSRDRGSWDIYRRMVSGLPHATEPVFPMLQNLSSPCHRTCLPHATEPVFPCYRTCLPHATEPVSPCHRTCLPHATEPVFPMPQNLSSPCHRTCLPHATEPVFPMPQNLSSPCHRTCLPHATEL